MQTSVLKYVLRDFTTLSVRYTETTNVKAMLNVSNKKFKCQVYIPGTC